MGNVSKDFHSTCKKGYRWNPSTRICENSMHLKNIVDDSVIVCDEIKIIIDSVSTNVTNSILENVTSTVTINFDNKNVSYKMDFLHTFLLVTLLLFMMTIIYYHYAKHRSKQKNIGALTT